MAFSANYIYCYIKQKKPIQMNLFLKNFINNCQRGADVNIIHLAIGGDINYSYRVPTSKLRSVPSTNFAV